MYLITVQFAYNRAVCTSRIGSHIYQKERTVWSERDREREREMEEVVSWFLKEEQETVCLVRVRL